MPQTSVEPGNVPPPDEVKAELETILASAGFRRSERHAKFLRYICETALDGQASKLNEYLIAHEVFGRGDEYSPGEDSVVRRQAHSLRQKLQDYYTGEGKDDPVRIELPTGRYVPVFVRRQEQQPVRESLTRPGPEPAVSRIRQWWPVVATCAAVGLFALGWLSSGIMQRPQATQVDAAVTEIWGPWLSDPAGAVICFSNPLTAVVKQFRSPLPPSSQPPRIPVTPQQEQTFREALGLPPGGFIYLSPAISQSKTGEALGSLAMAMFFTKLGVAVHPTQSRFLSWEDFRSQNLILLGHDEANRWLDPILSKLPLRLASTEGDLPRRILNTKPERGQPSEYHLPTPVKRDQPSHDYALVSMTKGIDGRHQLLLINGLNTEGTQMAMEFLTDFRSLQSLAATLHRSAPNHAGQWEFQFVLRTEVRDKVPTNAELLIAKVL